MNDKKINTLWLGRKDFCVFVTYFAVLCLAIHFYQSGIDDGRGWMISRSFGIRTLLFEILRYEGHPCLWYLFLWIPAHLNFPFRYINWLSAPVAIAGIYVYLRYSPFPFYLKAILPFGFALAYQYAVVVRSYVFFPLLGFLIAHLYRRKSTNPLVMALALALLANVSVHGTIVAIGFGACYWWRLREEARAENHPFLDDKKVLSSILLFAGSVIFVVICLWPTKDLAVKALHLVTTRLSSTSANYPVKKLQQQQAGQGSNVPLQDQLASVNQQGDSSPVQVFSRFRLFRIGPLLSFILVYPIASYHPLALLFEGATVVYLYRSGNLRLLIPFVLLVFFFLFVYESVWHLFMLWITLLLIFWISWDNPKVPATSNFHKAVALLLFVVGLLQVAWTVAAIRYERKQATYPARATADYLKTLPSSEQIAGVGFADTVRPYFLNSILNAGYAKKDVSNVLVGHPDIILVDHNRSAEDSRLLLQSGYRQTHTFCGAPYFPNLPLVPVCLTTYERFNHVQINGFTQP